MVVLGTSVHPHVHRALASVPFRGGMYMGDMHWMPGDLSRLLTDGIHDTSHRVHAAKPSLWVTYEMTSDCSDRNSYVPSVSHRVLNYHKDILLTGTKLRSDDDLMFLRPHADQLEIVWKSQAGFCAATRNCHHRISYERLERQTLSHACSKHHNLSKSIEYKKI